MAYETLLVDREEAHIGVITLNRPEQLNAFNTQMAVELASALREMDADAEVRVIIIRGAGKVFSAGIDLNEFWGKNAFEYKEWVSLMEAGLLTMMEITKPVVAQVHGVAAANGGGVVAASDLAVASENARIGFTAINAGLFCLGPAVPLMRAVGRKEALELLYLGELVPAADCKAMGLVNRVVPDKDLESETLAYARRLAEKSPLALQMGKSGVHTASDMELRKAFEYMNEAFARLCTTQDAQEGIKAFLEKRRPNWEGR
ncbi:MAG: enoyl-CoA hydratase/isomerase family protein [Desulfobacteraceae bacterium]